VRSSSWFAPTPPSVAIEIASRRVTVAELGRASGTDIVAAYATEPLPAEAVTPALTGANIANPALVADALRRALDKAGIRGASRTALVVPDSVARVSLLHFAELPAKASDLDQLIRWQLRKATPFPIHEAQISAFRAHQTETGPMLTAVVARRDVIAQYEAVTSAVGIHAGVVDLASFNVMNAVVSAGASSPGDWLVVTLAAEATTLAIMRGHDLMFYRHRAAVDEEPLSVLVHQTAMYHEDRLGGTKFTRVWLCGSSFMQDSADEARREIADRLGVPAETVDIRPAAGLRDRATVPLEVLDVLAAPVGVLLRERKAA
jgi:Tfp pilus assembly PilM family ATPase